LLFNAGAVQGFNTDFTSFVTYAVKAQWFTQKAVVYSTGGISISLNPNNSPQVIIYILQMRKLRHTELKRLAKVTQLLRSRLWIHNPKRSYP
jgi:hypothetical protein